MPSDRWDSGGITGVCVFSKTRLAGQRLLLCIFACLGKADVNVHGLRALAIRESIRPFACFFVRSWTTSLARLW